MYLPVAQDTQWQKSSEIDLSRTAVVIVDILGGKGGVVSGLEGMAEQAVRIVKAARAKQVPIIFCNDAHLPKIDREIQLWGDHGMVGTDSARPLDAFDVQDTDFMIPKRRYDGFYETDLDMTLRELGVDTLIVCGCDTNICVMQTLAGAFYRGYKTIVPADACATFLIGTQEDGLTYFTRCFDSRVVDTDTVLNYL